MADDEKDICLFVKRFLERRNFRVSLAPDGARAKSIIERGRFDYFLLDCSMPEVSGLELIHIARMRNPGAKIVLISGFPSADIELIQKLGADFFIAKPIQMSQIDRIFR